MTVESNLPVVIASMGHVQRIAHKEMAHPEAQQAAARQNTPEELKQAQEQVQKTDASEESRLKTDKDGTNDQQVFDEAPKRKAKSKDADGEPDQQQSGDPWQGNIIDLNV